LLVIAKPATISDISNTSNEVLVGNSETSNTLLSDIGSTGDKFLVSISDTSNEFLLIIATPAIVSDIRNVA
jgi:hypothetical protein